MPKSYAVAKTEGDSAFLQFIHDRLVHVHGENPNYDYMHRLRDFIDLFENHGELIQGTVERATRQETARGHHPWFPRRR